MYYADRSDQCSLACMQASTKLVLVMESIYGAYEGYTLGTLVVRVTIVVYLTT